MNDFSGEVINNEEICEGAFLLEVGFDKLPQVRGGQFAMLEVPRDDCVLRRPLGICMADDGYAAFLYQLKGKGTRALSYLQPGDGVRALMPLGNGFPMGAYRNVAIVGGGFGIAPLYMTAANYGGGNVRIYNGFATKKQIMLEKQFSAVGELTVCTDDGSYGFHGFPTQSLQADIEKGFVPDVIFCCGPDPLMKAVARLGKAHGIETYVSLEAHMGCGVGACLTCTCKASGHNKRVCKDGPVFLSTEVYE